MIPNNLIFSYLLRDNYVSILATSDILLRGSIAAERTGVYWVVSDKDHPAHLLNIAPNRAAPGIAQAIGIVVEKVMLVPYAH